MQTIQRTLLVMVTICPAGACAAAGAGGECRRTLDRQAESWNRGDIEGFLAGYRASAHTVFASRSRTTVGFRQMAARYRRRYDTAAKMGLLRFSGLSFAPLSGDEILVRGRWRLTKTRKRAGHGKFVLVMLNEPTGCRVAMDYTTSAKRNTPATGTPARARRPPRPNRPPRRTGAPAVSPAARGILKIHTAARRAVGVPPLVWDRKLARYARAWADRLAVLKTLRHRPPRGPWKQRYGENIAMAAGSDPVRGYGQKGSQQWLNEKRFYRHGSTSLARVGHYTQMVWRSSKRIGCGLARYRKGSWHWIVLVCNYDPPGNMMGQRPY